MGCCQKKKQEQLIDKNESKELESSEKNQDESNTQNLIITKDKFESLKLLGTGSFGRVLLVRFSSNNSLYAMKILNKEQLKIKHQEEHTKTERDLMVKINNPFIVNIKFAFQDETKLYIVSDFMQGGDMFYHLHSNKKFNEERSKFYAIELILGLEFLHKNKMIYRDLKPENILMDSEGHLKISDFGLSKILENPNDKAYTLCGTPQYLAPEVLKNKGYDKSVDWWSLGCFIYEMLTGFLPFYIPKGNKINPKTFEEPLRFPPDVSPIAINLITQLLNTNPKRRLGGGEEDASAIKKHPFFKGVEWDKYWNREIKPPFVPDLEDELDLKYFDKMFTDEPVTSNRTTAYSRPREHSVYKGFTYITNSVKKEMIEKKDSFEEKDETEEKNEIDVIEEEVAQPEE
jgi:protein-serine/threonine kinase